MSETDAAALEPISLKPTAGDEGESRDDVQTGEHAADPATIDPPDTKSQSVRTAMMAGLLIVLTLAALAGWLGFRAHESQSATDQRNVAVQVAKQGAINLTTIDWQHADADIQRILDGATGQFYDDFSQRSQPFVEVVKQAKSTSVGTLTAAALESDSPDDARVLVTVSVKTTAATTAPDDGPRLWRMRMTLHRVDDQMRVANVEFVT